MKKIVFFSLMIFLIANRAFASVRINEIMYDVEGSDTGREWIEVYNDSAETIDLSKWKLFEANTNHSLTSYQGGNTLQAGDFALIVNDPTKFVLDWPSFSGAIFDSTFSLSNTGESLALKDENLNIIDQASYNSNSGATGDGKSLQLIDNKFIPANPTPGKMNDLIVSTNSSEPVIDNSSTDKINTQVVSDLNSYKLEIVAPEKVFAGMPIIIGLKAEYGGQPVTSGRFYWNFGNGETKDSVKNEPLNYTYDIPGDYLIVLDYIKNMSDQEPISTARFKITVLPTSVVVPVAEVPKVLPPVVEIPKNVPPVVEQKPISVTKPADIKKVEVTNDVKVKAVDLEANVLNSVKEEKGIGLNNNKQSMIPWLLALCGFILISLFSIFFFKKTPNTQTQNFSEESEDFEIN